MSNELACARTGAKVIAQLLHPDAHIDGTYCVAIIMSDLGWGGGGMARIMKTELTADEILDLLENPGASPFQTASSGHRDEE